MAVLVRRNTDDIAMSDIKYCNDQNESQSKKEYFLDCSYEDVIQEQKKKSEDGLSMISYEYDQCPEFDDLAKIDEDGSFEFLTDDDRVRPSNYVVPQTSNCTRRGSEAMKQFSIVLINKINRKFYSMRIGEWWKIRTKINSKVPVYLLGTKYMFTNSNYANLMGKKEFMLDFVSRFWFTYRQNFQHLPCSKTVNVSVPDALRSSDCGWGCTLRSGQMLMAQALSMHFLGRSWRRTSTCQIEDAFHRQIIKWFADTPKVTSPFSIHQILRISDYNPGDWFGPSSICNALAKALVESQSLEPKLENLRVYFAQERIIFRDEVNDLMKDVSSNRRPSDICEKKENSVIFMIPLFLGTGPYCSPSYLNAITKWLKDPACLGLIGGKPRHSIFVIGVQDKNMVYLDPHLLQDAVNVTNFKFPIESFHCFHPLVIPFRHMDPNCAVGFYCRDLEEVNSFLGRIGDLSMAHVKSPRGWLSQPLFEVIAGYPPK